MRSRTLLYILLGTLALVLAAPPTFASGNDDDSDESRRGPTRIEVDARSRSDADARAHSRSDADARSRSRSNADARAQGGDARATGGDAYARGGQGGKANARGGEGGEAVAGSDVLVEGDTYTDNSRYEAGAPAPAEAYGESNCNSSGASATGTGGGVSIGVSSYACDVQEMHDALLRLQSGHCLTWNEAGRCTSSRAHGFWDGKVPTFWLKAQLLTKGFWKTLWPF